MTERFDQVTGGPASEGVPDSSTNEKRVEPQDWSDLGDLERRALLAWVGENLPRVRRLVFGQRLLYQSLGLAFVVGLAAHVGGYLLASSTTTEPLGLVADLLYALGWSLWTGVVVTVFAQLLPEMKRRQLKQALDAYEATLRDRALAEGDQSLEGESPPQG